MFALSTPFGIVKLFHNVSDLGMVIKNIVYSSFILKLLPRLFQMYKYMGQHCLLFLNTLSPIFVRTQALVVLGI